MFDHSFQIAILFSLERIERKLDRITTNEEKIMVTQAELVTQLGKVKDQLVKVAGESTTLLTKIDELKAIIAGTAVSPELLAAVDAVAAQAQIVDDSVPDVTP